MQHWETLSHRTPAGRLAAHDLSGAAVAVGGCMAMAAVTVLSIVRTGSLGVFFGVCFVLISLTAALAADVRALFVPGVLPPLLLIATVAVVSVVVPDAINVEGLAASAGALQRTIAGVIDHATALVVGHLLALITIGLRIVYAPGTASARG